MKNNGSANKIDILEWDFPTCLHDTYCSDTEQVLNEGIAEHIYMQ
jgi:hypothetical protein